jgi:hypothetical protein
MSALAHALKEKGSRECGFAKARSGAGWNAVKAGVLPGKVTGPVNTVYALEAEGQRGAKRRSPSFGAIKPQIALRRQGGALLQKSGE